MNKKNTCIICDSNDFRAHFEGLLRCKRCSHIVADLSITDEELRSIYKDHYFSGGEYKNYVSEGKIIRKNFQLRFATLLKHLDKKVHKNLFEVGCAYGFFLEEIKSHFESVRGIDISEEAIKHAQDELKLDVTLSEFTDYRIDKPIDVGCMWDTIEHLRDPDQYLKKLSEHMAPGGLVAITTGDIDSLLAKVRKENWRLIHPPTHIHYFSKKTLSRLLQKFGFKVVYSGYCGFYRSLDFTLYNILVLRSNLEKLYHAFQKQNLDFPFYINTYDIMYLIAKKT